MQNKKEFYIVWNKARNEGFITDDPDDALHAAGKEKVNPCSTVADMFHENYSEDQELEIETIELGN